MMLFKNFGSNEADVIDAYMECAIGATGAVGAYARNKGVTVARNGVGDYTFTFDGDLAGKGDMVNVNVHTVQSAISLGDGVLFIPTARTATTLRGTFIRTDTMVAAEVRNGASICARFAIKRSTV